MPKTGRTTGGTIFRLFNGEKFLLRGQFFNKTEANTVANKWKKNGGYFVRVTKHPETKDNYRRFRVWIRARRVN